MKLRKVLAMYVKAAILSWLIGDFQGVYMTLTDGTRVQMAGFYNGRLVQAPSVPDTIPVDWATLDEGEDDE